MILLAFFSLPSLAVEVGAELGWGGQPVLGAVNPLWLTVTNPAGKPFSGKLRILARVGSPWRGEAVRLAEIPLLLAPFGRAVLTLEWPVDPGMTSFSVQVLSEDQVVFSQDFPVRPATSRLRGAIGPPDPSADLVLSPSDLPANPLLLWPFSELKLSFFLPSRAQEVLRAWEVFLARGLFVQAEPIRQRLRALRPAPPIWSALVPGMLLYLLALGLALSHFSRGRFRIFSIILAVFLGLSLFYGVMRESAESLASIKIEITSQRVGNFRLELLGLVSWRGQDWGLSGVWHELLPSRGWRGFDLRWEYGPTGWTTRFSLLPGVPRVFLRLVEDGFEREGEPVLPAGWLREALSIPWEEAEVRELVPGPGEKEVFWVRLP